MRLEGDRYATTAETKETNGWEVTARKDTNGWEVTAKPQAQVKSRPGGKEGQAQSPFQCR